MFRIEGWALLFSPELLHGTPLAARMKEFTFFAYQVNEALHMTAEERATLIALMKQIQEELCRHPDVHQRTILVAYIELILRSCFEFLQKIFLGLMYPFSCVLWAIFWSFSLLFFVR